ncbi:MAG: phosphotransferase family protein [Nevskia sp.]|nr:phosphotransferase family protein [Nevskia sp.]
MLAIDKQNPPREWIESLRRQFPCEREIDRVLQGKLARRGGPGYKPIALATLCSGLQALLRAELREPFEVLEPQWLAGGASKLQMAFKLSWQRPGAGRTVTPMVLRMEPAESIVETSRLREFQLIKAMQGVVPVPEAYWADPLGKYLPYPAIVYGFVDGAAKPKASVSNVTGLGINFGPAARGPLGRQYVEHLAAIHTFDWRGAELSAFDVPQSGAQSVEWMLNWWARIWREDANEEIPLLRLAEAWLRRNAPPIDRLSLVHGDYRAGNFLYSEDDLRITAWLDWELAWIGDRHADLAYMSLHTLGHYSEDGGTYLQQGLMPMEAFLEAYEKCSGLPVDRAKFRYYRAFHAYRGAIIMIATGYRAARGAKTHQDLLLAWAMGLGYVLLDELREVLEQVG